MDPLEQEQRLMAVLDRQVACDSLDALVAAMKREAQAVPLNETAIAIDANVFLRLASHPKSADIIDYLDARHAAPLILPGQAIQEFWNNQLQVVDTVAAPLKKSFENFKLALNKVDRELVEYTSEIGESLDHFGAHHGHIYDEGTVRKTLTLLDVLVKKAIVPYGPRAKFHDIAAVRKRTRTPPGFKDDGDGDFFIWVDLLTGLQKAQVSGPAFGRAVLVSQDRKLDWSRGEMAHPILAAEVRALLGVAFEIWTTEKLAAEIALATSNDSGG